MARVTQQLAITVIDPPVDPGGATFDAQGNWTPAKDANGNVFASEKAGLPLRQWKRAKNTQNEATLKPLYDAAGYNIYRLGSNGYGAKFDNFSGAAVKPGGSKVYFHGGGHEGGSDNSVDEFDTDKHQWRIVAYPSKVGIDGFTQEDEDIFSDSRRAASYQGTPATVNIVVRPYSRSSTGFAVKVNSTFSPFIWYEAVGPARTVTNPLEVIYPNGGTTRDWAVQPAYAPFGGLDDCMPDGRPTPRHTYSGFKYINSDTLMLVVRANWKFRLDGTGFVKQPDGGRTEQVNRVGELITVMVDDQAQKLYRFGCGSNCSAVNYFYYRRAMVYDVATGTEAQSPILTPETNVMSLQELNLGDAFTGAVECGRRFVFMGVGNVCASYDLDTGERIAYDIVGPTYTGTSEGNPIVYVSSLGSILRFDSRNGLACWRIGIDSPGPVKANGRRDIVAELFPISQPPNFRVDPLTYTRLWVYEGNILVYASYTNEDVYFARVV